MRITAGTFYRDYAKTVNDLHSRLNEAMDQVSTGKKYKSAADNAIAYYAGEHMDSLLADLEARDTAIDDVKNRLYQQEQGALSIQNTMRQVTTHVSYLRSGSQNGDLTTVETMKQQMMQELTTVVNDLNLQYENYYVYGGNDATTVPFSIQMELTGEDPHVSLTYSHQFPGESEITNMRITYHYVEETDSMPAHYENTYTLVNAKGEPVYRDDQGQLQPVDASQPQELLKSSDQAMEKILSAMREQGKMSLGYGSIQNRSTLPDTFTGGLNMITGLSSDALLQLSDQEAIQRIRGTEGSISVQEDGSQTAGAVQETEDSMMNTPVALISKAILASQRYISTCSNGDSTQEALDRFTSDLGDFLEQEDDSESRVSNTYRTLGIKYDILDKTKTRISSQEDALTEEYSSKLGIDPYEAIVQMYANQSAYQAAMKVGSSIMQSSLFDFVK